MSIKGKRKKILLALSAQNDNSNPDDTVAKTEIKDNQKVVKKKGKKSKRKIDDAVSPDDEEPLFSIRDDKEVDESAAPADAQMTENESKPKTKKKKNKKRKVAEKEVSLEETATANSDADGTPVATNDVQQTTATEKEESKENTQEDPVVTINKRVKKKSTAKTAPKVSRIKKLPSGLVIEKLVIGDPKAQRASHGKKVGVHYIGKLKNTDKMFDSNLGSKTPFKFRLGMGRVIKGLDVGINGMRVGDKRRLTIPPAMGYGSKGCDAPAVPRNAWLVCDVELVSVH